MIHYATADGQMIQYSTTSQMDTLFEASFSPLTAGGKPWSKCGITGRSLREREREGEGESESRKHASTGAHTQGRGGTRVKREGGREGGEQAGRPEEREREREEREKRETDEERERSEER